MVLLITPAARAQECAAALEAATGQPTRVADSLRQAVACLRSEEYSAVVVDQNLMEAEPDDGDMVLQRAGTATPIQVNVAICGIERLTREVRSALLRRKNGERLAREATEESLRSQFKSKVTALLLNCELALQAPNLPSSAAEKMRTVCELARSLSTSLEAGEEDTTCAVQNSG
jgi:hypothetical protein